MSQPQAASPPPAAASSASTVDQLLASFPALPGRQASELRSLVEILVESVGNGALTPGGHPELELAEHIADIDTLLCLQVNEILHAPEFQRLEGAWRGLQYLVSRADTGELLKIRVLNASKSDLAKDLESASEFDQSALFWKIYEEEYGTFGGEPYGAIIGDYEFGRHPQDIALLERFSGVVAAAHTPFLAAASPAILGWESFAELSVPRDLGRIFGAPEYVKWRSFRDSEDSRYVGLTLPRILLREPYDPETTPTQSFPFQEAVDGTDQTKYLWGSSAWAFGARLAEAFARFSWCAMIRGVEGGGLVEGLLGAAFDTDTEGIAVRGPTEFVITDLREKELADQGFIPLAHCKGTENAAFFSAQSCQRAKRYDTDEANANARMSTQLQYIFSTSRFAHYLKVMMRDKTGSNLTVDECERFLNDWLLEYCLSNPEDAGPDTRARKPLREARASVRAVRGKPGVYEAVIHLQPHFQLDELTVNLRLVTELPRPARAG